MAAPGGVVALGYVSCLLLANTMEVEGGHVETIRAKKS